MMREFKQVQKVYIKSPNHTKKISLNYTISLLFILLTTFILYLIFNYHKEAILLSKNFFIITITIFLLTFIINIFQKKYQPKEIYRDNNLLSLSIILCLFSQNNPIYVILIATIITIIIKNIDKKRNLSTSLYGIIILITYKYAFSNHLYYSPNNLNLIDYLINPQYISPILSIIASLYLFHKKNLKYHIVFSYIITNISALMLYVLLKKINIEYILLAITINSLIFLSIYSLADYQISPTIGEVQIIYGIIVAMITIMFSFIIPHLSVVIPMLIAPLILTTSLEKISPKLKYNHKKYHTYVAIYLITTIILVIIISKLT